MTQTIDALQFADLISARRGAQFVTMNTKTIPELIGGKSNKHHNRIEKCSVVNGVVNWSYENAVNAQREREQKPLVPVMIIDGSIAGGFGPLTPNQKDLLAGKFDMVEFDTMVEAFHSQPRKWGQRIAKTAFVRHIKELKKNVHEKRVYVELKVERSIGHQYFVDGEPIDDIIVNDYIRSGSESDRQGVDKKIILRDYRLSSITGIKLNGEFYNVWIGSNQEEQLYDSLG